MFADRASIRREGVVVKESAQSMREYETLYVLRTDVEDQAAVDFINKMKALVEKQGGKHIKVTNWGRKKLAWERDRQQKGLFVHHQYLGNPGVVKEYERTLGIDENVLLRQTVLLSRNVSPDARAPEEDQLVPPAAKERRDDRDREDGYEASSRDDEPRRHRDRDDDRDRRHRDDDDGQGDDDEG